MISVATESEKVLEIENMSSSELVGNYLSTSKMILDTKYPFVHSCTKKHLIYPAL